MPFEKGKSGNPKGRPRGTGSVSALRAQIAEHVPDIVKQLIDKALAGDMLAVRMLLDRALPTLRSEENAVTVALPTGTMVEQGDAIMRAAAAGEITPAQASALTGALASLARIKEVSELEERIAALEAAKEAA
ncbi:DUF5681 domain-containing protein [Caballeronia sordidicola]|uniref:DUF5681 domain-containing protein n=1 Tax=Caballeronia sordidicola TaxID=196367 RepID=A0A242MM25_CABSO|nr:DUF5681 domain-containing protein [Caballeronia sordidicola]OTP72375.1 hypothetical protein PAMC26510_21350 [Caballeronia sordidicola]